MHRTSVIVLGLLSLFAFFAVVAIASVDDPKSDRLAAASPGDPALAPAASAQPLLAMKAPSPEPASMYPHHAILDGGGPMALAKPERCVPLMVWHGKGHLD